MEMPELFLVVGIAAGVTVGLLAAQLLFHGWRLRLDERWIAVAVARAEAQKEQAKVRLDRAQYEHHVALLRRQEQREAERAKVTVTVYRRNEFGGRLWYELNLEAAAYEATSCCDASDVDEARERLLAEYYRHVDRLAAAEAQKPTTAP